MYDRIWTGSDLWRSLLAVSPDKADRTSDFFFGKTAAKCGGKITEKTDCGRGNSVDPGDFDQYRDSMSDATRLFRFFWNVSGVTRSWRHVPFLWKVRRYTML